MTPLTRLDLPEPETPQQTESKAMGISTEALEIFLNFASLILNQFSLLLFFFPFGSAFHI